MWHPQSSLRLCKPEQCRRYNFRDRQCVVKGQLLRCRVLKRKRCYYCTASRIAGTVWKWRFNLRITKRRKWFALTGVHPPIRRRLCAAILWTQAWKEGACLRRIATNVRNLSLVVRQLLGKLLSIHTARSSAFPAPEEDPVFTFSTGETTA